MYWLKLTVFWFFREHFQSQAHIAPSISSIQYSITFSIERNVVRTNKMSNILENPKFFLYIVKLFFLTKFSFSSPFSHYYHMHLILCLSISDSSRSNPIWFYFFKNFFLVGMFLNHNNKSASCRWCCVHSTTGILSKISIAWFLLLLSNCLFVVFNSKVDNIEYNFIKYFFLLCYNNFYNRTNN